MFILISFNFGNNVIYMLIITLLTLTRSSLGKALFAVYYVDLNVCLCKKHTLLQLKMPTKCSVSGCENYYSKGVPFFDVPSPLKYKFCSEKAELSKKRRTLWLEAMGILKDSSKILRICSKHFVTGKFDCQF